MENNTANVNQENGAPAGKKGLPAYIILGIIALVAAVALAVTNMITKGPIQERADAALREAFNAVMHAESYEAITIPSGYEVSACMPPRTAMRWLATALPPAPMVTTAPWP